MKKRSVALILSLLTSLTVLGQELIPLYDGKAPGSEDWPREERVMVFPGTSIALVQNVTRPSLRVFAPPPGTANGAAVIVAPGGAFETIVEGVEGTPVAERLNAQGFTVFLLRYRLFQTNDNFLFTAERKSGLDPDLPKRLALFESKLRPLVRADARRAISYVREHAAQWGVDPRRIGFMGFSAGGTVASVIAQEFEAASRPDFVAAIYGAATAPPVVPAQAPPLFIVHAADDPLVPATNSVDLFTAWRAAGFSAELHIYAEGGHGFGVRQSGRPVDSWLERFGEWVRGVE